ncbi:hypothetical protein ACT17S_16220 [Glutamicibacter mysorens]
MSPYIGESKVVIDLPDVVAGSLVANRTLAKVPAGASQTQIERIWDKHFGTDEEEADTAQPISSEELERPRGNASRDDWEGYALSVGISEDDLAGKKQSEIRDLVEAKEADSKGSGGQSLGDGSKPDETE